MAGIEGSEFVMSKAVATREPLSAVQIQSLRAVVEQRHGLKVVGEACLSDGTVYFELDNGDVVLPYVGPREAEE